MMTEQQATGSSAPGREPDPSGAQVEVKATVDGTVFRNEENGYSVISVKIERRSRTVVGVLPPLSNGEQVTLTGVWITHPQYGEQFKVSSCEIQKPTTLLGIERYLGSGSIKGVGPAMAKLIVQEFGKRTLDIMSEHPERLTEIPGIGKKRAAMISQSYQNQHAAREAMVFLQSYGVSMSMAVKITKAYGADAQRKIRENPYCLVDDIQGIGFQTADQIAQALGIGQDSEFRLRSGMKYVLQEAAANEGHTFLPREMLIARAAALLRVPGEMLQHEIDVLCFTRELVQTSVDGTDGLAMAQIFYTEREIARYLLTLKKAAGQRIVNDADAQINGFEKYSGMKLSENQRRAVSEAVTRGMMVITGGPGTGKTTIINCILSLLGSDVLLAAPTGRAAKRMSEATGRKAQTLHRLLEYSGDDGHFMRNEENPLKCECVIVDETSMVDVFLMRSLLRALSPGTRLILVGDADQLPSVGAGNVLGDILQSGAVPYVRLTDIFRQAGQSMIVTNAHRINHGEAPILNQKNSDFFFERQIGQDEAAATIVGLCARRLPAFLKTNFPARDIQVLSPIKKTGAGVHRLNELLQEALNPPAQNKHELTYGDTTFRKGDKVMHVHNNYQLAWKTRSGEEGEGVFNGDIGFVTNVDLSDKVVTVCYDDDRMVDYDYQELEELELAYCMSVHKSQGSEFPCVVMPVVGGPPRLLTRNLFYTALTRAKKLVVLVGREEAITALVQNNLIATRYTLLRSMLENAE